MLVGTQSIILRLSFMFFMLHTQNLNSMNCAFVLAHCYAFSSAWQCGDISEQNTKIDTTLNACYSRANEDIVEAGYRYDVVCSLTFTMSLSLWQWTGPDVANLRIMLICDLQFDLQTGLRRPHD